MTTAFLKSKLAKHGIKADHIGNRVSARVNGYIIGAYDQNGLAVCLRVRREGDEDDSQSDYSAGCFCDTFKQVQRHIGF